jgi:hypothetical protein
MAEAHRACISSFDSPFSVLCTSSEAAVSVLYERSLKSRAASSADFVLKINRERERGYREGGMESLIAS